MQRCSFRGRCIRAALSETLCRRLSSERRTVAGLLLMQQAVDILLQQTKPLRSWINSESIYGIFSSSSLSRSKILFAIIFKLLAIH